MLTEQQKTQYNQYRAEGLPPERALSIATRDSDNQYNPALEAGVDNILFGKKSLTSAVGGGIKEAAVGGFKDVYDNTQKYGAFEATVRSPFSLLAGAGRGVGEVVGGVLETADDLTGETVSSAVMPRIQNFAESETGQKLAQGAQDFNEATHGASGDVLDILNLAGVAGIAKSSLPATLKQGYQKVASEVVSGASKATESAKGGLKSVFGKSAVPAKVTAEQAEDQALKAAAELLQSGSKKSAKGRQGKYNNADTQAMKAIRDSDVPLNSQQNLADFFDDLVGVSTKERDALLRPFLNDAVDGSYMGPLKAQIKELRVADEMKDAAAYAQLLKKEADLFAKIGKAAPGGKNTVEQLSARIKEINKKVQKLFDDAGGKENLLPDQKIEAQAYDLLRQGLKTKLDEIGGEAYKEAGLKTSGLLDARTFSRIQRDRAKNALTGTPWAKMTPAQRAVFVKDLFPTLKDFGVSKLVKLDTKADVLDALVAEKVRLIREFGSDAVNALP